MARHSIERTVERFVTGALTTDGIFALSSIKAGRPMEVAHRRSLESLKDLFAGMTIEEKVLETSLSREKLNRSLDAWEVITRRHEVIDTESYVEMLRDASAGALEPNPQWGPEMEELQDFLVGWGEYELAKMNSEHVL